jgi:hypothetical protein
LKLPYTALALVLSAALPAAPTAQCQLQELVPLQLGAGDHLGYGVGIDGDVAIAGAMQSSDFGPDTGSAYVFRLVGDTWTTEQRLTASDASPVSRYGYSADIAGDVCAIGSPHHTLSLAFQGAAYLYRYDGANWNEEAILTAPGPVGSFQYGYELDLSDEDTLLVGAPRADTSRTGKAYLYRWDGATWALDHVFLASDGQIGDQYGINVAIQEPLVVIGASTPAGGGKAYVYRYSGGFWREEQILVGSDTQPGDEFGNGVAVDGDTIVVGAPLADQAGTDDGAAYVFRYDGTTWNEEAKLVRTAVADSTSFGYSCELEGDLCVVGSPRDDENGFESGAAFTFRREGTTWTELAKLTRRGAGVDEWFGGHLAMDGDYLMSGAYHVDSSGALGDSGAVTVYSSPDPTHATCYGQSAGNPARLLTYGETPVGGTLELIYEAPSSAPMTVATLVSLVPASLPLPFGVALIDPAQLIPVALPGVQFSSLADRPRVSIPLPPDPGLGGITVYLQALLYPTVIGTPTISELTNGVAFTFGI